jgi:hypothetical protein
MARIAGVVRDTGDDSFVQLTAPDGRVIAASPVIARRGPLADPSGVGRRDVLRTIVDRRVDDDPFRLSSRRVETSEGAVVLNVVTTMDVVVKSVVALVASLTVAVPLVAALLAALMWHLVGRTLRSVETIRAVADDIGVPTCTVAYRTCVATTRSRVSPAP